MQQVLCAGLTLQPISNDNKLQNTCDKRAAARLKAMKLLMPEDHEQIMQKRTRREMLEHNEVEESADELEGSEEDSEGEDKVGESETDAEDEA